ncbi:MAG: hypothetical protein WB496_19535 [Pseudolabrys sp.]
MKSASNWHPQWGNVAQIVSAVAVLCAVVEVIFQLSFIRGNAKEASARQVYMSYSEATLKYPELSQPNYEKIKADPVEYVRYKNYVSHMLFAFDEILSVYDTPEWRNNLTRISSITCAIFAKVPRRITTKCIFQKCASFSPMRESAARICKRSNGPRAP